jgi:hypothetical protein
LFRSSYCLYGNREELINAWQVDDLPYIKRVARPGHDIVLNSKFEFPRYEEYFDRKAAIDVYQLLMQQVQDMKAEAQIP